MQWIQVKRVVGRCAHRVVSPGIALLVLLVAACAHQRPNQAPVIAPPSGEVGVELLQPGAGDHRMQLPPNHGFSYPTQVTQPMPAYPGELLPQRLQPQQVCVDLDIDVEGNVGHAALRQGDGCPTSTSEQQQDPEFAEAVLQAVRSWRYSPAMLCIAPDASASPCAHPRKQERPTPVRLGYVFRFSQINGKPKVDVGQAAH